MNKKITKVRFSKTALGGASNTRAAALGIGGVYLIQSSKKYKLASCGMGWKIGLILSKRLPMQPVPVLKPSQWKWINVD